MLEQQGGPVSSLCWPVLCDYFLMTEKQKPPVRGDNRDPGGLLVPGSCILLTRDISRLDSCHGCPVVGSLSLYLS